jgi:DNA-binding transcriptional LysR family regulator
LLPSGTRAQLSFGSKCEELNLSKSCPPCRNKWTSWSDGATSPKGQKLTFALESDGADLLAFLSLVAVGLGISLVPACMQGMALEGVVYRRLAGGAQPKVVLNLAARGGDPSPVVRRFLTLVRRAAREWPAA